MDGVALARYLARSLQTDVEVVGTRGLGRVHGPAVGDVAPLVTSP